MTLKIDMRKMKTTTTLLVLGLLVFIAYSNTFLADWHMDDYPNILQNPAIQITDLGPASLKRAVGVDQSQGNNLKRPVANLTFALNWYAHGSQAAGYHLVNLLIHVLNALILYLVIVRLCERPVLPESNRRHRKAIALAAALLWALNPIQTQAVTYVVQRYTSLAAFFILGGLYSYIRGRLSDRKHHMAAWWALAVCSYVLALGVKENTAVWPLTVLLVEFVFFRDREGRLTPYFKKILIATVALGTVLVGGFLISFNIDPVTAITGGFDGRPFSLAERLMTQPRVLLFHLSQIFYPIPQRLSLEHDFSISHDLLQPWTTLPAIFFVGLLIIGGLIAARKRPIPAFAILFFFLNHVVESSVLPLEMVFEHRNYLPSVFLFWPLVVGALHLRIKLSVHGRVNEKGLSLLVIGMVMVFTIGTYARNMVWQTERGLWQDTYRKAPQSARAAVNLANELARSGHAEQAAALYAKAIDLYSPAKNQFKVTARSNLATLHFQAGRHAQAVHELEQALLLAPQDRPARYSLANILAEMGKFTQAEEQIDWLLERHPDVPLFLNLKTFLMIKSNRAEEALAFVRRSLTKDPNQRDARLAAGVAHSILGNGTTADWFFRRADDSAPRDPMIYLCRLENFLENNQGKTAAHMADRILKTFSLQVIKALLNDFANEIRDQKRLGRFLAKRVIMLTADIHKTDKTL